MKKLLIIFLLAGITFGLSAQASSVNWAMSLVDKNGESLTFSRPVEMKNGDVFSIQINLETNAYCYVVAQDPDRSVAILHKAQQSAGSKIVLGPMQLTPPTGAESIYIIVSAGTQKELENKIAALTADAGSRKAGRDLINEVFNLRRDISKLKENAEKPVAMGGAFRKMGEPIPGISYSGAEVYVKTITINH